MGKVGDFIERTEKWKIAMIDNHIDNILRQLTKKKINLRAKHIIIKNLQELYFSGIPGWGMLIPRKELNHKLLNDIAFFALDLKEKREYCKSRNIKMR